MEHSSRSVDELTMDFGTDEIKSRRSSILKPRTKNGNNPESTEQKDELSRLTRRVSFASSHAVKPFLDDPEKNTIWDNTYEEEVNHTDSTKSSCDQVSEKASTINLNLVASYTQVSNNEELLDGAVQYPSASLLSRTVYNETMEITKCFEYDKSRIEENTESIISLARKRRELSAGNKILKHVMDSVVDKENLNPMLGSMMDISAVKPLVKPILSNTTVDLTPNKQTSSENHVRIKNKTVVFPDTDMEFTNIFSDENVSPYPEHSNTLVSSPPEDMEFTNVLTNCFVQNKTLSLQDQKISSDNIESEKYTKAAVYSGDMELTNVLTDCIMQNKNFTLENEKIFSGATKSEVSSLLENTRGKVCAEDTGIGIGKNNTVLLGSSQDMELTNVLGNGYSEFPTEDIEEISNGIKNKTTVFITNEDNMELTNVLSTEFLHHSNSKKKQDMELTNVLGNTCSDFPTAGIEEINNDNKNKTLIFVTNEDHMELTNVLSTEFLHHSKSKKKQESHNQLDLQNAFSSATISNDVKHDSHLHKTLELADTLDFTLGQSDNSIKYDKTSHQKEHEKEHMPEVLNLPDSFQTNQTSAVSNNTSQNTVHQSKVPVSLCSPEVEKMSICYHEESMKQSHSMPFGCSSHIVTEKEDMIHEITKQGIQNNQINITLVNANVIVNKDCITKDNSNSKMDTSDVNIEYAGTSMFTSNRLENQNSVVPNLQNEPKYANTTEINEKIESPTHILLAAGSPNCKFMPKTFSISEIQEYSNVMPCSAELCDNVERLAIEDSQKSNTTSNDQQLQKLHKDNSYGNIDGDLRESRSSPATQKITISNNGSIVKKHFSCNSLNTSDTNQCFSPTGEVENKVVSENKVIYSEPLRLNTSELKTPQLSFHMNFSTMSPCMDSTQQLINARISRPNSLISQNHSNGSLSEQVVLNENSEDMPRVEFIEDVTPVDFGDNSYESACDKATENFSNFTLKSDSLLLNVKEKCTKWVPVKSNISETEELFKKLKQAYAKFTEHTEKVLPPKLEVFDFEKLENENEDISESNSSNDCESLTKENNSTPTVECIVKTNTMYDLIVEASKRNHNIWCLRKAENNKYYFRTLYHTLLFVVEIHEGDGRVLSMETKNKLLGSGSPLIHFMLKIFMQKLEDRNLKLVLGEHYDIITMLDYVCLTFSEVTEFEKEFSIIKREFSSKPCIYHFRMNDDLRISFKFLSMKFRLHWTFVLRLNTINEISPENVSYIIEYGHNMIVNEHIRKIAADTPKGPSCLRCFLNKLYDYVSRKMQKCQLNTV